MEENKWRKEKFKGESEKIIILLGLILTVPQ